VIALTERDRLIVLALLFRVPLLAEFALARFWPDTDAGRKNMARRLAQLCAEGLLARHATWAKAADDVALFYRWAPGTPVPAFGSLAWELEKRWEALEMRRVVFFTATDFAARHYGRTVRNPLKALSAVAHNIGLGATYAEFALNNPTLADAWVAEEVIAENRGHGEKVVDSAIVDSTSTPALAVEFAGSSYAHSNGERLREIHQDCSARKLPYEVWTVPDAGGGK
jgi:hypothetical protein